MDSLSNKFLLCQPCGFLGYDCYGGCVFSLIHKGVLAHTDTEHPGILNTKLLFRTVISPDCASSIRLLKQKALKAFSVLSNLQLAWMKSLGTLPPRGDCFHPWANAKSVRHSVCMTAGRPGVLLTEDTAQSHQLAQLATSRQLPKVQ